jgi:hypothetical protein
VGRNRSRPLVQRLPNKAKDFYRLKRLRQDRERSGCLRAGRARCTRLTGNDDDRYRVAALPEFFKKVEAAHSRHVEIKDQAILAGGLPAIEKRLGRRKVARFEACAFEQQPKRIPDSAVVVDNENHLSSPGPIGASSPPHHYSALI